MAWLRLALRLLECLIEQAAKANGDDADDKTTASRASGANAADTPASTNDTGSLCIRDVGEATRGRPA